MATRNAARLNARVRPQDEDEELEFGPQPAPPARGRGADDQPEEEPDDDGQAGAQDGAARGEKSDRVDLRNIKVRVFDGTVAAGQFDARASDWWSEFAEQVEDAQLLAAQDWSEAVKKAVLSQFLTGMAKRWFRAWRQSFPDETFASCGAALVKEFRPNLLHADIAEKIRVERKRWDETYREFADRLMQMADALDGGCQLASNSRQALVAFTRNAYPRYTDFIESKIDLRSPDPPTELWNAIAVLSDKAGTDGRGPEKRKAPSPAGPPAANKKQASSKPAKKAANKGDKGEKKVDKKRAGEAHAAAVERKRAKTSNNPPASTRKSITGYECGQDGHTAAYCRKYLQGKGLPDPPASANQATADDDDSSDSKNDSSSEDDE
jgi:hypothetical protein